MKQPVFLWLSFLICHIRPHIIIANFHKMHGISDLLQPQLDLQINLRIPDYFYGKVPKLSSAALTESIRFLVSQDVPFGLFYNFTTSNRTAPLLVLTSPRHLKNQVVWPVFVILQHQTKDLDLEEVFHSCIFGMDFVASSLVHKDWLQVMITDETDVTPWRDGIFLLAIRRTSLWANMFILKLARTRALLSAFNFC